MDEPSPIADLTTLTKEQKLLVIVATLSSYLHTEGRRPIEPGHVGVDVPMKLKTQTFHFVLTRCIELVGLDAEALEKEHGNLDADLIEALGDTLFREVQDYEQERDRTIDAMRLPRTQN